MKVSAVVPARGDSRGVIRKNVRELGGKPLVRRAAEAGLRSDLVDHVIVSTDDDEVAALASRTDADVRFTGPNLHNDNGVCYHVELDVMEWLSHAFGYQPDVLLRLQPTSPFRTAEHIDEAYRAWSKRGAIVGVEEAPKHPTLLTEMQADGTLTMNESRMRPRQDYDPVYAVNGALYMARTEYWRKHHGFFGPNTEGYVMDSIASWDIDEPEDWRIARALTETGGVF